MENSLFSAVYLLGAAQAVILGGVLMGGKQRARLENRVLLALLVAILFALLSYLMVVNEIQFTWAFWNPLLTAIWFTIAPLFYFFARLVVEAKFRFRPVHLLYFLFPFYNLLQIPLESAGIYVGFHMLFSNFVHYSYVWLAVYHIYGLVFAILALRVCRRVRRADQLPSNYTWLYPFFILLVVSLLISAALLAFATNSKVYSASYEWLHVLTFEIFIFWMVFQSLRASRMLAPASLQVPEKAEALPANGPKYANSNLEQRDMSALHEKLATLMKEEQPYLEQSLSLSQLAKQCGVLENHLSQLFSQYLESNFYDVVNAYRLDELERRLVDPQYQHFKIVSIAEDCGFTSKASFYRYFKSVHQMTPTQYLRSLSQEL